MKAAFLVGVRELEIREVLDPVAPADGLVLKVEACGVCGSDLRRWREGPPVSDTSWRVEAQDCVLTPEFAKVHLKPVPKGR